MNISKILYRSNQTDSRIMKMRYRRLQIVIFFMVIVVLLIVIRMTYVSIFKLSNFRNIVNVKHKVYVRKNIIDRNGMIMASTLPTASAYLYLKYFTNTREYIDDISKIISINIKVLEAHIKNKKHFVWLKRHLTPKEQQSLHDLGVPGLYFINDQKRFYPHKNLFSHTVGLVDVDNKGISGLELQFDKVLKNHSDNINYLQTSLDTRIQYIVYDKLSDAVRLHKASGGVALVMDINNGELISTVSLPDYNPYNIKNIEDEKLFNRVTLGVYEMGSILKVLTLAIGIDTGVIDVNDCFDVSTPIKINNYSINDYRGGKGGILSIPDILVYSSNIGVAKVIQKIGTIRQKEYFKKLGMLSKNTIELPEKSSSIFPSDNKWKDLCTITMSYGHGIAITPIHLIEAFSSVVNKGIFNHATLIKKDNAQYNGKRIFSCYTSKVMNNILKLSAQKGFAKHANLDEYSVGAKTGTAEKIIKGKYNKNLNIALCAASFPMNDPKYSILVLVDEPKKNKVNLGFTTGGMIAAPIIADIISKIAPVLGVPPIINKDLKNTYDLSIDCTSLKGQ